MLFTELCHHVAQQINKHFLPQDKFILAISGGVDSMVLLAVMTKLCPERCLVVSIDHHLRETSASDTALVASFCQEKNIAYTVEHINHLTLTNKGLEERARTERYRILKSYLVEHNAKAIVTAHHAQDQVETQIMHLIRGSDIPGLIGMSTWNPKQHIFRPLLNINKIDLQKIAKDNHIRWHEDETNSDIKYFRNHIRHNWLPIFNHFNFQGLTEKAEKLQIELNQILQTWNQLIVSQNNSFTRKQWLTLPLYVRLTWLHRFLSTNFDIEDVTSEWIGHMYHWIETAKSHSSFSHRDQKLLIYEDHKIHVTLVKNS